MYDAQPDQEAGRPFARRASVTFWRLPLFLCVALATGTGGGPSEARAQGAAAAKPAGVGRSEIILLGTKGGPGASAVRSEPASLLTVDGEHYLVDVGDGTARQLASIGMAPRDIQKVFITHHHLDHTAGLEPLISLSWIARGLADDKVAKTAVYGPPSTKRLVQASLDYLSTSERIFRDGMPRLQPAKGMFSGHDLMKNGIAFEDGNVKVTAVENAHFHHKSSLKPPQRDMSFSYRFETKHGSVVFTGDTGPSDAVVELAKGADILVSEVFMPRAAQARGGDAKLQAQLAYHMTQEHLTPEEVGKMATRAGMKTVVLTHFVPEKEMTNAEPFVAGVKAYFSGNVIAGTDLMRIDLATGQVNQSAAQ